MGSLTNSTELSDLVLDRLTGETKAANKSARRKAALEKQTNQNLLDETLGSYSAQMASMGIDPDQGSAAAVKEGYKEETALKNAAIDQELQDTLKSNKRAQKKKWLQVGASYGKNLLDGMTGS